MASRLSKCILTLAVAALGMTASGADVDPLARPEFDQELTLSMTGSSVVRVYDAIASFAHVPFILAFDESAPGLNITFKAQNMGIRGLLAQVAKTYDLEYVPTDGAVLVKRKGQAPTEKRKTVGPWQPPVALYRLDLLIRARDGRVLSTPHVTTPLKQKAQMIQGIQSGSGAPTELEIVLSPQHESDDGLELALRWSIRESATKTAGAGETVLFTTPEGTQVVLQGWSRRNP